MDTILLTFLSTLCWIPCHRIWLANADRHFLDLDCHLQVTWWHQEASCASASMDPRYDGQWTRFLPRPACYLKPPAAAAVHLAAVSCLTSCRQRPHSSSRHRSRAQHCAMSWRNAESGSSFTVPSSFHSYSFQRLSNLCLWSWRCFDRRKKSWRKPKFYTDYISVHQNKTVWVVVGFMFYISTSEESRKFIKHQYKNKYILFKMLLCWGHEQKYKLMLCRYKVLTHNYQECHEK